MWGEGLMGSRVPVERRSKGDEEAGGCEEGRSFYTSTRLYRKGGVEHQLPGARTLQPWYMYVTQYADTLSTPPPFPSFFFNIFVFLYEHNMELQLAN
jgi:hypothetical protein